LPRWWGSVQISRCAGGDEQFRLTRDSIEAAKVYACSSFNAALNQYFGKLIEA